MSWLLIVVGLLLLVGGGEALVRGASGLALLARITPAVVGLTIVAAGTSMPELVVSVQSALKGSSGIALGNVVGSNIFNIGAIVGLAALVRPLRVMGSTVKFEWPIMMVAAALVYVLIGDQLVSRPEGALLAVGLVLFLGFAVWLGRRSADEPASTGEDDLATASFGRTGAVAAALNLGAVLFGVGLLAVGSTLLVDGAVAIAQTFGVSDAIIGLTIVAAGTSTPELMTSLVASYRGRDDIAIANVVGSNIFNVLAILGPTAIILPLGVPEAIANRDVWWMLGFSVLLFPLMRTGMRVTRVEGGVLFTAFLAYMGVLVSAA